MIVSVCSLAAQHLIAGLVCLLNEGVRNITGKTFRLFCDTGRERLIRSHSLARFCFELSGNSN